MIAFCFHFVEGLSASWKPQVLRRETLLLEPALDDVDDLFDLERLQDVIVRAALHRIRPIAVSTVPKPVMITVSACGAA